MTRIWTSLPAVVPKPSAPLEPPYYKRCDAINRPRLRCSDPRSAGWEKIRVNSRNSRQSSLPFEFRLVGFRISDFGFSDFGLQLLSVGESKLPCLRVSPKSWGSKPLLPICGVRNLMLKWQPVVSKLMKKSHFSESRRSFLKSSLAIPVALAAAPSLLAPAALAADAPAAEVLPRRQLGKNGPPVTMLCMGGMMSALSPDYLDIAWSMGIRYFDYGGLLHPWEIREHHWPMARQVPGTPQGNLPRFQRPSPQRPEAIAGR